MIYKFDAMVWSWPPTSPPLKNYKNIGFPSNSGPDPLKNYEATEPAFNVGPLSACQRNTILMAFRWRADICPLIVVLPSSQHASSKQLKKMSKLDPLWQKYLDPRMRHNWKIVDWDVKNQIKSKSMIGLLQVSLRKFKQILVWLISSRSATKLGLTLNVTFSRWCRKVMGAGTLGCLRWVLNP